MGHGFHSYVSLREGNSIGQSWTFVICLWPRPFFPETTVNDGAQAATMSLQCLGRPRSIIGHDSMYSTHKNIGPMNGRFLDSIIRVVIFNYPYLMISYSFQVSNIVQLSYLFRDCYQYLEPKRCAKFGYIQIQRSVSHHILVEFLYDMARLVSTNMIIDIYIYIYAYIIVYTTDTCTYV